MKFGTLFSFDWMEELAVSRKPLTSRSALPPNVFGKALSLLCGGLVCFSLGCSLNLDINDLSSLHSPGNDDCATDKAPVGAECAGGSLYLGTMPSVVNNLGDRYMIMPGGCDGSTDNPVCSGDDRLSEVKIPWGPRGDTSGAEVVSVWPLTEPSKKLGDASVKGILDSKGSLQDYLAAKYCDDMVFGGYSDWYLPSKSEMAYVYCKAIPSGTPQDGYPSESPNCATYGGKDGILPGFADSYWTSTEGFSEAAWLQYFSTGVQGNGAAKDASHHVRCIRRIN